MRDEQRGLLERLLDLQHLVAQQQARLLVERGERFVHQQDARLGSERARNGHALPHAAGKLRRITALETRETDEGDEMRGTLHPCRLRHSGNLERKRDVLQDGAPRKRRFLLEHHADRGMRADDGRTLDRDAALVVAGQPADDVEERRLAAAGGPDDRYELAGRDGKRDVVDGDDSAVARRETLGDVPDVEQRLRHQGLFTLCPQSANGWHGAAADPQRGGIWISSASCSFVSGAAVNLSATASGTIVSRPTILSGSTAALGKKSSRVRLAIAGVMPTNSA